MAIGHLVKKSFIINKSHLPFAVGGALRIKSFSKTTNFTIIDNIFDRGRGCWGAYFDFEVCFSVVAKNNIFQNGICISLVGAGICTGSTMVMTAGIDIQFSSYIGSNNKFINGFGESKGH